MARIFNTYFCKCLFGKKPENSKNGFLRGDYLIETTHPSTQNQHSKIEILNWATSNQWLSLEIVFFTTTEVIFKAFYKDHFGNYHTHAERSTFKLDNQKWYYLKGSFEY